MNDVTLKKHCNVLPDMHVYSTYVQKLSRPSMGHEQSRDLSVRASCPSEKG
jgi:hypothetical protein